jgi:hypothetical protein
MTTTHPPAPTTTDDAPSTPAVEAKATGRKKAAAPVQLAVIFTPELNEACLQSCRGGSLSWAFGPVTQPTTLRINPGLNGPIDQGLWERAKERPDTQVLMGRGLIQEIELADGTTNDDGELTLGAVSMPVAIRLIYGCRDTDLLERWLRKEDRQQVRERVAARIKEINDGKP